MKRAQMQPPLSAPETQRDPKSVTPKPTRYIDLAAEPDFKRGIFNAMITPRPIGWISTLSEDGFANLAPFSYFNLFSTLPPILCFSCNTPEDRHAKDTLANVRASGEFVYNMATLDLVEQMNATAAPLPHGTDEFKHAGLEKGACIKVKAPRVLASPVNLECKVLKIVRLGEGEGDIPSHATFGQVVGVHVQEEYMSPEGYFLSAKAQPLARLGGIEYAVSAPTFELDRVFRRAAEDSY